MCNILIQLLFMISESTEIENYVNNVKEQIMNSSQVTDSDHG